MGALNDIMRCHMYIKVPLYKSTANYYFAHIKAPPPRPNGRGGGLSYFAVKRG